MERVTVDVPQDHAGTLRDKLQQRDWSEMWQLTHRMHGAAAICGVPALYHALGDLQPAITLEDESSVSVMIDKVAEQAQRLAQAGESRP